MTIKSYKSCYCYTCHKAFNYLGITRHRAMHRDKKQDCEISYTNGDSYSHKFNKEKYDPK